MKRYRLYLESSFWRRLGDPDHPETRRVSYRFLRAIERRHRILVSRLLTQEIGNTPDLIERRSIIRRMEKVRPRRLTMTPETLDLRDEILREGGWTNRRFADALHIAYTLTSGADALVTWDLRDLARDPTRDLVRKICRARGLSVPRIGTPEEVAAWLGLKIE